MFRPTSKNLFRPKGNLGTFKLHQPLPLNPRESRQLLNLLTTSFRQQLEREHGSIESDKITWSSNHSKEVATKKRRNSQSYAKGIRPTDEHLKSVLTNPLFTFGPSQTVGKSSSPSGVSRDPMQVFDEACGRGLMTLSYAKACLVAKKRSITQSSAESVTEGMKASGAGLKVVKWMASSGLIKVEIFVQDVAFLRLLTEYLVAEGLGDVVLNWSKEAIQRHQSTSGPDDKVLGLASHLLYSLVKAQATSSLTLDSAYQTMGKAQAIVERLKVNNPKIILGGAGCWLSYQTCLQASNYLPSSPAIYNIFLDTVNSFTGRQGLHLAHLSLHHPTKPSAKLALSLLKETANQETTKIEKSIRSRTIAVGLDAAKLLLEQDKYSDAKWVMGFLQKSFPEELGLDDRTSHEFELAKAEASNLELLQSLNLT